MIIIRVRRARLPATAGFVSLALLAACGGIRTSEDAERELVNSRECLTEAATEGQVFPEQVEVEHSALWDVEYRDNVKVVTVGAQDAKRRDTYILVQCGTETPPLVGDLEGAEVVSVPVAGVIPTYYEDVTALYELGLDDNLVAVPDTRFLDDAGKSLPAAVTDRLDGGDLTSFGEMVSVERFLELDPDVVFAYSVYGYDAHDLLEKGGIPAVSVLNASESTPLGDAEWAKFFALFFNAEADAQELFDGVEQRYLELAEQAASVETTTDVMFVSPYSADYFEAHRNSWGDQLIIDAGGRNLLSGGDGTAPESVSLETVVEAGLEAPVWLTEFSAFDLAQTEKEIETVPFDEFQSVVDGNVWNVGATDADADVWYGTWSTRPDLLLADLVSLLHPELLPDHELRVLESPVAS